MTKRRYERLDPTQRDYSQQSSSKKVKDRVKPRTAAMNRIRDQQLELIRQQRETVDIYAELDIGSIRNILT